VITLRTSPEICVKGCESILTERKQDMVVLVMVLQPSPHELRNIMEPWTSQVATTSKLLPSAVNDWRLFGCQWLENPPLPPNTHPQPIAAAAKCSQEQEIRYLNSKKETSRVSLLCLIPPTSMAERVSSISPSLVLVDSANFAAFSSPF
jgi:hypothetical protein